MTPERLAQIEALYHAAREAPVDERAALLAHADPDLRQEVELLLGERAASDFLDRPVMEHAADLLDDPETGGLQTGTRLGPYRIEHTLGDGGMGHVFRAVDTRLGRAVAIKTSHEQFTARFEREARAIASLNHPHICTLHDVGPHYLVMELVEGETMAARLKRGPLPMRTALVYASQIADALAAAHAKGIVHRDLKPANVMLTETGIKVLDFGLATIEGELSLTTERVVLGTPGYMAPEQREGKAADARTDLYAFGCVLYEMLTGTRATLRRRRIPSRRLEQLVNRCLEDNPERRWQSATELQQELAALVPARRATGAAVAAAATLVMAAAAAYLYFFLPHTPTLTDTDRIVLADFTNATGDPVFDETLRQGLLMQLEQSPFLSLVSDDRIRRTLPLMDAPPDARLTSDVALGVCVRTGSTAVLEGSIARLGDHYVLGLRAKNCNTGDMLANEQAEAPRKEEVLGALGQIAIRFRTRVGESLATVQKHSTPLEEATTQSLEALKAYSAAMKRYFSVGIAPSQPLLKRAVEIDPNFAMAYAQLGINYSVLGESALARANTLRAYQLRDRVSDRERFYITTLYDRQVTGNLEREQQTLEAWAQTYPHDGYPPGLLSGFAATSIGQYELAIEAADKALAIDPGVALAAVASKARNALHLGRLADAEATLRGFPGHARINEGPYLVVPYFIGYLRGDRESLRQQADAKRQSGSTYAQAVLLHLEALGLARSGRLQDARRTARAAVDLARQSSGGREQAALFQAAVAVWEAFYGNAAAAGQAAADALALGRGRDVDYAAAFALAVSRDLSRAQALADNLARDFPEDTSVQFMYLPTLRGLLASTRSQPARAIDDLQAASRFDLAVGGLGFNAYFGAMYPVYVRGEAYLAAHQPESAAVEFQKILDHRSIVIADPVDALARLQLARALVHSEHVAQAERVYDDLLTLWKDADPGVSRVSEARAEHARLRAMAEHPGRT